MPEAITESEVVTSNETESDDSQFSQEDGGDPSSEGDWAEARKAFESGEFEDHDVSDNVDEETVKADGEEGTHLETDQADQPKEEEPEIGALDVKYDLNDLRLPQKYKPDVQKKVDAILADAKTQAAQLTKGYQESNSALASAFVDIIKSDNPLQTLREYAEQAIPAFGLPQELLSKFDQPTKEEQPQGAPVDTAQIQQRYDQELTKIEDKYWSMLEQEPDPKKTRELFSRMDREKRALDAAFQNAQLRSVLQAYHSRLIKPQFDEFGKIKSETEQHKAIAERQAKVGHWNSADQQMSKQFTDWPKYKAKVKDLMKTKYSSQKDAANQSGKGHLELMQDLYLIVSRKDHLEAAKRPQRGLPGLKPSGKHIKTQKAGGSDWDDIKAAHWGDIIPAD